MRGVPVGLSAIRKLHHHRGFSPLDPASNLRYLKFHEFRAHHVGVSGVLLPITPALLLSGFQTQPIHLKAA